MAEVDLINRVRDSLGRVAWKPQGLVDALYAGTFEVKDQEACNDPKIEEYNRWCRYFDRPEVQVAIQQELPVSADEWDAAHQSTWMIPEQWKEFDLETYLFKLCDTPEQYERVEMELKLFRERNMYPLLRCLAYMIYELKEHKVVWGVGRGSSVSSYVLFLMGVHRVDSLKWELDVNEFLR